jgi:XTP/dITP diphosphohydrolase
MEDMKLTELLIGTRNAGKIVEIQRAWSALPLKLRTLDEFPRVQEAEESGRTYEENATIKALSYAKQTGVWAIADDSGLEVDEHGGAPGVHSARFAGRDASDSDRIAFLLDQLAKSDEGVRSARFVSAIVLADDERVIRMTRGVCEGNIINSPRGTNGFGYDPIFVPHGFDATFAELPAEVKDAISHRGKALSAMRQFLADLVNPVQ